MRSLKSAAIARGWLNADERLLIPRLAYPLHCDLPDVIHENNRAARDVVVAEALEGAAVPHPNASIFGAEPEIVVAETDRYGIPLRTVLGAQTGLMRSDPYYSEHYLARFYREHYRKLYRPRRFSLSWFFSEQIRAGQRILERIENRLPRRARILDVGCGMGGMLIPFRFAGHEVAGCDYGEEYARHGWNVGLDIRIGGPEAFADMDQFDLVILSHVLEHTSDPVTFLAEVGALVKPGGVCHIEVPGLLNLEKWYNGDVLEYLQNAHRWHFTAATLEAVIRRSGLSVIQCDQTIVCLASPGPPKTDATADDGSAVLDEIARLERSLASKAAHTN